MSQGALTQDAPLTREAIAFNKAQRTIANDRGPQSRDEGAAGLKVWAAVIGATLGAFMAVLNIQIVNASLADVQGGIGAGIDDGGWISTS
jgi:MFS transporter, DHA2 family, multidrug resistance protein